MSDMTIGFILALILATFFGPTKSASYSTFVEGQRICAFDNSKVLWVKHRTILQHTVKCENERTYKFNTSD